MRRRARLLLGTALGLLLSVVLAFGVAVWALVSTDGGRSWVQARVESAIAPSLRDGASVRLHGLRFVPLGRVAVDSLVVTDASGRAVVRTAGFEMWFVFAPLLDRELHLTAVTLDRPWVELAQDAGGGWNLASLVRDAPDADAADAAAPWRIRLDTLTVRDGRAVVTVPDSLPALPPIRRELSDLSLALGPSELRSDGPRGALTVRRATGAIDTPELAVHVEAGSVRLHPDSAQLDFPRLAVGAARLGISGSLGWEAAREAPRVALQVRADSVDLAGFAWASDLLPRTGTARARVTVTDGPARGALRYDVREFEVVATHSRLSGRLVADIGDSIAIRDVDVTAAPLDFRLVRELLGDSVPPAPWDGALRARIRARGGPLDRWRLDPSTIEFEDRRLGGARSRFTLAGTLDLLADEPTVRPLEVRIDSMDVRTAGGVVDAADDLQGFLSGRVRLEGPLSDLTFRNLDVLHVDGALPRSHVRGEGRIAADTARQWLAARLSLDTIGVAALGRAFTPEYLEGTLHGTLDVSAIGDSVTLALALGGDAGEFTFAGTTSLDTARLVALGELEVLELDLRRLLPRMALPPHRLTAAATLGIDGGWDEPSGPVTFSIDSTSTLAGLTLREGRGRLAFEPGGIRVDTLALVGPVGEVGVRGRLSRDPALRDTLRFEARVDTVAHLRGFLSDSLAEAWRDSLGGRIRISGLALGSLDTLDVRARVVADSLRAGSYAVTLVDGDLLLDGVPKATRGLATLDIVEIDGVGLPVHRVSAEATVREAAWADVSLRAVVADTLYGSARADIHWMGDSLAIRLDSLDARTRDAQWRLAHGGRFFSGPDRFLIDSLELLSRDGARFALSLRFDSSGTVALDAQARRVPLAHARFTGLMPNRVNGLLTLDAALSGTRADPSLTLSGVLDSASVDDQAAPTLRWDGRYRQRAANVSARGQSLGREAFRLDAELPIDLSLLERRLADRLVNEALYLRIVADGAPLAGVQAFLPGVRDLRGGFDADIQVTGQWNDLTPRGILLVREGAFTVPELATGFRDFEADVSLTPDSILIYRARLADDGSRNDTASVEGFIARTTDGWRTDIRTMARSLRVIDDPRVAEADVSWNLRLRGPLDSLLLGGDITVPTGNLYIGRQQRRVLELEEDRNASVEAMVYAPRLEGLRLRLGNEVRLRSPEANVQLTGEVNVVGTLDAPDVRGEIYATRGTYRLDLGLLQRTFQVDSGLVRLNGPLSVPPSLDIHTSYTVRQAEREDVRIAARLSGTVDQPRLTLSSADLGTTASETEIISYLLFGAPTFVLDGQSASAVRLATAALVPSLGGAAERALGARLPFLSELQFVTVAGDSPREFSLTSFEGLLNSFALTAGTQIGTDSYLRFSGGVCRGENRAAQSLPAWFGIAGEYRPRERLSAEVALTPGSAPCNRIGTFRQIYQVGLDLYRDWRW